MMLFYAMRGSAGRTLLALLIAALCIPFVHAGAVNITIDDQTGDEKTSAKPVYKPEADWSLGPQCSKCVVVPDARRAHGETWHDVTAGSGDKKNMTLTFTGMSTVGALATLFTAADDLYSLRHCNLGVRYRA
jgi:hypothetical protein